MISSEYADSEAKVAMKNQLDAINNESKSQSTAKSTKNSGARNGLLKEVSTSTVPTNRIIRIAQFVAQGMWYIAEQLMPFLELQRKYVILSTGHVYSTFVLVPVGADMDPYASHIH